MFIEILIYYVIFSYTIGAIYLIPRGLYLLDTTVDTSSVDWFQILLYAIFLAPLSLPIMIYAIMIYHFPKISISSLWNKYTSFVYRQK